MPFEHLLARFNRPSWQLAVLLVIVTSVCGSTVLFYRVQIAALREAEAAKIESIAAVKAEHLASLRSERCNDAVLMSGRPLFNDGYRLWLEAPTPEITAKIRLSLAAVNSQSFYTNIALFDTAGEERLRLYPGVPLLRCASTDGLMAQAMASGAPQMGALHRCALHMPVQWHLAAPLQVQQGGTSVPAGAILLAVNVPKVLLPVVNEWPGANASGETLIAERQGDTAVNLNDYRYGPAALDLAANGEEAIAALRGYPYRLVLMDWQMPVMGGLEATQRIRAEWGSTHPAIVALTGSTDGDDFLAAQAAGIDGWLIKPLRLEDLQLTLERWVFAQR